MSGLAAARRRSPGWWPGQAAGRSSLRGRAESGRSRLPRRRPGRSDSGLNAAWSGHQPSDAGRSSDGRCVYRRRMRPGLRLLWAAILVAAAAPASAAADDWVPTYPGLAPAASDLQPFSRGRVGRPVPRPLQLARRRAHLAPAPRRAAGGVAPAGRRSRRTRCTHGSSGSLPAQRRSTAGSPGTRSSCPAATRAAPDTSTPTSCSPTRPGRRRCTARSRPTTGAGRPYTRSAAATTPAAPGSPCPSRRRPARAAARRGRRPDAARGPGRPRPADRAVDRRRPELRRGGRPTCPPRPTPGSGPSRPTPPGCTPTTGRRRREDAVFESDDGGAHWAAVATPEPTSCAAGSPPRAGRAWCSPPTPAGPGAAPTAARPGSARSRSARAACSARTPAARSTSRPATGSRAASTAGSPSARPRSR